MKNLSLLAVILSLLGALRVDNITNEQVVVLALIYLVVLLPTFYLLYWYWQKNSLGIYWLIFLNTFKLNWRIERNKKYIKKLKKKIAKTRQKLFDVGSVDDKILKITDENIKLWHNRVLIHERLIDLCEVRTSSLSQNWNELNLLRHLIRQTKKEYNSQNKLNNLVKLIEEIDNRVSLKITHEIDTLIKELKTDVKKGKILRLETRIDALELKARNAIVSPKQFKTASFSA